MIHYLCNQLFSEFNKVSLANFSVISQTLSCDSWNKYKYTFMGPVEKKACQRVIHGGECKATKIYMHTHNETHYETPKIKTHLP